MPPMFNKQQIQAALTALKAHKETPFVKHQWEEIVSRLCHDSDPLLRERMKREMDVILKKDPGFRQFLSM